MLSPCAPQIDDDRSWRTPPSSLWRLPSGFLPFPDRARRRVRQPRVLARAGGRFGRFADRRLWNRADRGPSSKSSPVSLAGIGDDDLRRSCDSFIPRMSVTAASAPNSTIGSGTRWDRAVSFRRGIVEGVRRKPKACTTAGSRSNPTVPDDRQTAQPRAERTSVEAPPEHHGDDLKPSPELAAARKIADIRPTALREGQIAKARRILGRRSRVTNSKATWRSAGRCNLDRLKSSNRPAATCLEVSLADFLALARSVIQASRPAALRRVDQGKRPQRR